MCVKLYLNQNGELPRNKSVEPLSMRLPPFRPVSHPVTHRNQTISVYGISGLVIYENDTVSPELSGIASESLNPSINHVGYTRNHCSRSDNISYFYLNQNGIKIKKRSAESSAENREIRILIPSDLYTT